MAIFRSHREAAKANNRVIGLFFGVMAIVLFVVLVLVAIRYLIS
jgi:hypothetical protein